MSADFLLAFLFVFFGAVSFFTMLHLMGSGHTPRARTLRTVHRVSELLAILVFGIIVVGDIINVIRSGLSTRGLLLITLAAVLIPLFIIKNLISEKYPELRNRLISIGTTVLVIIFVFSASFAIFHYVETRDGGARAGAGARTSAELELARELFVTKCSKCHRLDTRLSETHTAEEWRQTVELMRQKDPTWISESQAEAIGAFLIHVGAGE